MGVPVNSREAVVNPDTVGAEVASGFGWLGRPSPQGTRRQLLRLADLAGYSSRDLNRGTVETAQLRNLERLLISLLDRRRTGLAAKRVIDFGGSLFALLLLAPLLSLVSLAVWLSSPGPIIFAQLRHGQNGRPIRVLKFRTFYADKGDTTGVRQTVVDDPRVTPLGRLLRRTNIDELPQLWNVLVGDMSLVGPRPHPIGMRAGGQRYEDLVVVYPLRTLVKPGITGLAQLRGFRGPTTSARSARMRVVCDLVYLAHFSILFDIRILLLTLWRELRGGTGQ